MKSSNVGKLDWSKLLGFEQVAEHRGAVHGRLLGKVGDKFGKVGRKIVQ